MDDQQQIDRDDLIRFALSTATSSRRGADEAAEDLRTVGGPIAVAIADGIAAITCTGRTPTQDLLAALVERAGGTPALSATPRDVIGAARTIANLHMDAAASVRRAKVDALVADLAAGHHGEDPVGHMQRELAVLSADRRLQRVKPIEESVRDGRSKLVALKKGGAGMVLAMPFFAAELADWIHGWTSPFGASIPMGFSILIAGMSGAFKTTLGNAIAASAIRNRIPVLFYQAELDADDHALNIANLLYGLPRNALADDGIPEDMRTYFSHPTTSGDAESVTELRYWDRAIAELNGWLRRVRGLSKVPGANGVVVIDYLQLLVPGERHGTGDRAVLDMTSELVQWAKANRVLLVVLSNMSRGSQRDFGNALAKAYGKRDRRDKEKAVATAVTEFGRNGMAGADVIRAADCSFVLARVDDQLVVGNLKSRTNAWEENAADQIIRLVDVRRDGTWHPSPYTLSDFLARVDKDRVEEEAAQPAATTPPAPSRVRTAMAPAPIDVLAEVET